MFSTLKTKHHNTLGVKTVTILDKDIEMNYEIKKKGLKNLQLILRATRRQKLNIDISTWQF